MKTSAPYSLKIEEIRPGYFRAVVFGTATRADGSTYAAVAWAGESSILTKLRRNARQVLLSSK